MKKVIISIAAILVLAGSYFVFSHLNKQDISGSITITLIDEIGDTLSSKTFTFTEEDTLFDLLSENYEVGCANTSYQISTNCVSTVFGSRVLMKIDTIETNWANSYIAIYENDEYSVLGVDSLTLNDGDIFKFVYQEVGGDN